MTQNSEVMGLSYGIQLALGEEPSHGRWYGARQTRAAIRMPRCTAVRF